MSHSSARAILGEGLSIAACGNFVKEHRMSTKDKRELKLETYIS